VSDRARREPAFGGSPLPGEEIIPSLRARVRQLALAEAPAGTDVVTRITDVLHLWSAFDRSWMERLLPSPVAAAAADPEPAPTAAAAPSLDPRTPTGQRLQDVWSAVIDELVRRGRTLNGANLLPFGIEELMTDAYLVAARKWPAFEYHDREQTIRWFLSILHNLLRQTVHRGQADRFTVAVDVADVPDATGTQATRSKADEREWMRDRVVRLNAAWPAGTRAADLTERLVGRSTLELFVAAETLETAHRLSPEDGRLWALLAVRQVPSPEAAKQYGIPVGTLNVRFHRLRGAAIGLLANSWAGV
jgi:DNA-directed RNA polymerase specialized sigma24 family protein